MPRPDHERLDELLEDYTNSKKGRRNLRIALRMAEAGLNRAKDKLAAHGDERSSLARQRVITYLLTGVEMTGAQEEYYRGS
ncbi:MAG: hypothetical protein V3U34_00615 [candidate division NC10 bacterium]